MLIEQIDEVKYTRLISRGINEFHFEDEFRSDKYFYHIRDGETEAVLMICKHCFGLMPVIKLCGNSIYVGSGRSIDIIDRSTLRHCGHYEFCSPVFDLLVESERVIAVTEIDVVVFDSTGYIEATHRINEIIVDYSIRDSKIFISTFDGHSLEIDLFRRQ